MGQLGVENEAGPQGGGRGGQAHLGAPRPTSAPELILGSRDAFSPVQKLGFLNFLPILQVPLANSGYKEPKGSPSSLHKAFGH